MATTMRMRPTEYPHIFWNIDKDLPCVAGTRLRVQDIAARYQFGDSMNELVENFPPHTHAEIFAALAYYFDHKEELDEIIAAHERSAEEMREIIEARQGPSPLRAKLRARGQQR